MADLSLNDARAKVEWAKRNYAILRSEVVKLESEAAYRLSPELDADGGVYTIRVHDLPKLPDNWGVRIGDCVHNARCSLDYIWTNLVAFVRGTTAEEVERVQFPIYQDGKQFNGAMGELRGKEPVLSGWISRIEELQPFNAGNPSIWGWHGADDPGTDRTTPMLPIALDRLTTLDNVDKHRCLIRPWWGRKLWFGRPEYPAEFGRRGGSMSVNELVDGAEVSNDSFEVPLPFHFMPTDEDLKHNDSLQISIKEPSMAKSLTQTLDMCLWGAEAVLEIFEPVFSRNEPPLPVTVSLPRR